MITQHSVKSIPPPVCYRITNSNNYNAALELHCDVNDSVDLMLS